MRLIDADKLFDFLTEQLDKETGAYKKGRNVGLNIARSALHDETITPTIAPPPNDPLTLEELREMDGEPMWISGEGILRYDICCGISSDNVVQFYKAALPIYNYERTWLAYRRKPEEVKSNAGI